jgi:peptide/nickel transport system substrate-binding protein
MSNKLWTRREFLRTAALGAAGVAVVACQPKTVIVKETVEVEKQVEKVVKETVVVEKEVEVQKEVTKIIEKEVQVTVAAEELKEAPDLYAQVAQGKLAPVAERMPLEPRVVQVVEEIGTYGGTWRRVAVGPGDVGSWNHRLSYDCPLRYGPDGAVIEPHIIKGFEVSDDGAEFTLFLRKGHRFSDGEPFTADDLMYWYEDNATNEEMSPNGIGGWLAVEGEGVVVTKVDDYTTKWSFVAPYGLFIAQMAATRYGWAFSAYPKHYLQQFHPTYTKREDVEKVATDEGYDNWMGLHGNRRSWRNPDLPSNKTWIGVRLPPDIPCSMERNAYYFLMDPEGNQLPYIDRIRMEVVENKDVLNLKAVAGAVDHQFRHLSWENFPLFVENAEQGDFRVVQWTLAQGANVCFAPNQNHEDPGIRELMETKEFRQALSVAIDREEMNEVIFMGLGTPRQASVVPSFPAFKPEHATAYAQYDPDLADELLDGIGLTERDSEGFRLRLDGEPLTINCEYAPVFGPWGDVIEMCANYWADVGIRVFPKEESRDLFSERGSAGTVQDMSVWMMDRSAHFWLQPIFQMPIRGGTPASSGALYNDWYDSGGESGEEPPDEVKKAYELVEAMKTATSDEELIAFASELLDLNAEELWYIGTVGLLPHVGVVKNNMRNVLEEGVISDWLCLTPGNTTVEQYFFKG